MPLTEERANQILMEEVVRRREKTPDADPEEAAYRQALRRDVRRALRAGIEVVIQTDQPDPTELI